MYSPTEFLVEVNKVAKAYPGADKHVAAIRKAVDVSKHTPPQQRLNAIERALVTGLMTKSFRSNDHMASLTKAWHKYRQWHHKHARKAYPQQRTVHKVGLRQLPAHLFDAEIARRLPTADLESLARAAKTNNPATAPLETRRQVFEEELRVLTEFGAILLQVPVESAIELEYGLVDGELELPYPLSGKCVLRDIPGGRIDFEITGTYFRALHTLTKHTDHPQTFIIQSLKDKSTGKYVSLVRVRYTTHGSSRAKTMLTSHGFMPSWAKIVKDAVRVMNTFLRSNL